MANLTKKLLFCSFFLSFFVATSFAQSYPVGYYNDSIRKGVGEDYSSTPYKLSAAIELDSEKLDPFEGCEITSIRIGMTIQPEQGSYVVTEDLKVFVRQTLEGEDIQTISVDTFTKPNGWLDVKLNTPIPITKGQKMFIGYSLRANNIPLGFGGEKKSDTNSKATWIAVNDKWQSYSICGNACIAAMVSGEKIISKKPIIEQFTAQSCGSCPMGYADLEKAASSVGNVIWVSHHAGFAEDVFTIVESRSYVKFYNELSIMPYAPAAMIDRVNMAEHSARNPQGNITPGAVFTIIDGQPEYFLRTRKQSTFVSVNIAETFDPITRDLNVTVSGKVTIPELLGDNLRLNVFLAENGIVALQAGGAANYVHNNVMRDVLSEVWGDDLSLDAEGNYSKTYIVTLKSKWVPANMKIAAFVANYDEANINNCEVYNAEQYLLKNNPTTIAPTTSDNNVSVYSENSSILVAGEYSKVEVFNTIGQLVASFGNESGRIAVEKGIYTVRIVNGENTISKKVLVK